MNRHERRKAKVMSLRTMTPAEAKDMPLGCAWDGCKQSFKGEMPAGWRWLLLYHAPEPCIDFREIPPGACDRDTHLCPEHARALDSLLYDLARWANLPMAGAA